MEADKEVFKYSLSIMKLVGRRQSCKGKLIKGKAACYVGSHLNLFGP